MPQGRESSSARASDFGCDMRVEQISTVFGQVLREQRLSRELSQEELALRAEAWKKRRPVPKYSRGYYSLYVQHVLQADKGCDLDFLTGASGSTVERESH